MAEVMEYAKAIRSDCRCIRFPFMGFARPFRVRGRLDIYHKKWNNWCASGAMKWQACMALYDNDEMKAKKLAGGFPRIPDANHIRRPAGTIRADVTRRTPLRCMDMEASTPAGSILRLFQFPDGPAYMYADDARDGDAEFRRVGYGFYAEDYYDAVSRFGIDRQGRGDQVQFPMMCLCKNAPSSIRPKSVELRDAIMCDIFFPPGRG